MLGVSSKPYYVLLEGSNRGSGSKADKEDRSCTWSSGVGDFVHHSYSCTPAAITLLLLQFGFLCRSYEAIEKLRF